MKTTYGLLVALLVCIGVAQSNNTTAIEASARYASYCYYCANCPNPWNPNSAAVTTTSTNNGWCTIMTSSSGYSSRGAATPGLCTRNECAWKNVAGVSTWVCCCDQNYCNAATSVTTTYRPIGTTCYYCSTCPVPFNRYSPFVSDAYSQTGWCAKMSTSSSPNAIATRGVAAPGLCTVRGCSWKLYNNVNTWVCCCNGYHCNTALSGKKATVGVLGAALALMFMVRKNF